MLDETTTAPLGEEEVRTLVRDEVRRALERDRATCKAAFIASRHGDDEAALREPRRRDDRRADVPAWAADTGNELLAQASTTPAS